MSFPAGVMDDFLHKVYDGFDTSGEIEPRMWREVLRTMNEAAAQGLADGRYRPKHNDAFLHAMRHGNEVFSAFKVHAMGEAMAEKLHDSNGNLKSFEQWVNDVRDISSHHVGAWLRTEYDTAVLRAHAAADWQEFVANKDIMPNLRWMPTTSPNADASHKAYWEAGLTLPVDHPFWAAHHPQDRWNCKCSLEATDEPVTPAPVVEDIPKPQAQRGLDNNPGQDGHLFNDSHPYFPDKCANCPFYKPGVRGRLKVAFWNHKKNCFNCSHINNAIDEKSALIKSRRQEYQQLKKDENYRDVKFDKKTGGLRATHVGHITHEGPKAERFFNGLTSTELENECVNELFKIGKKVILRDETKKKHGQYLTSLDIEVDGTIMDIRSVTGKGWYSNIFVNKNNQLHRFNAREDVSEKADSLCLYFHDPSLYDEKKMIKSINFFRYRRDNNGKLLEKQLKHVHCVIRGTGEMLTFEI